MRLVQQHLTYANVVATISLFIVLGGSAYAVTSLPSGSVGGKQLRSSAVTSSKVKDRSLLAKDFKTGELPRGARGSRGATGAAGARGATGPQGPPGDPGSFVDTLPPGATLRGAFMLAGHNPTATIPPDGVPAATQISWGFRLSAHPTVNVIPVGGAGSFACPGTAASPEASPGNVCLYQTYVSATASLNVLGSGEDDAYIDSRYGLGLFSNASGVGLNEITGTWAVTGPATH